MEIIGILFFHWIADFVIQTDYQARNKSKKLFPLLCHILTYTFVLSTGYMIFGQDLSSVLLFALINGVSHFLIDFISSKINTKLYMKNKIHTFFISVGFDQFLHLAILTLTI